MGFNEDVQGLTRAGRQARRGQLLTGARRTALDCILPWAGAFATYYSGIIPPLALPPSAPRDALNRIRNSAGGLRFGTRRHERRRRELVPRRAQLLPHGG